MIGERALKISMTSGSGGELHLYPLGYIVETPGIIRGGPSKTLQRILRDVGTDADVGVQWTELR